MFEELKEEIRDIIENNDGDFEDIYENSKNNSVGVKPVPNKRRITLTEKGKQVLEVKFNEVLPLHIAHILNDIPSCREAVSKFAICRSIK